MTNHWIDLQNSDCILIQGCNPAENHPISFKWVMRAKDKGATVIHVDPRFTRTSARASMHAPIRSGTDIAFLGGMIKYIIDNDKYFKDYVVAYTNAPILVNEGFSFKDGLFSGFDADKRVYDKSTWTYQKNADGTFKRDPSLKDPHCVFQLLKKHYKRYDINMVSRITGTPKEDIEKVYKAFASTGVRDRAGTIMYALGQTHHTVGVQNIRSFGIIQLLLGNIGIPGGGINALRGEPNVQGSTDHALLFYNLPGYLAAPRVNHGDVTNYLKAIRPVTGEPDSLNWQSNYDKYAVSLFRSFFPTATEKEGWGYDWLPKLDNDQDASVMVLFDEMYKKHMNGFICAGQNPACSIPDSNKVRAALRNLKWMVHANIFDNETASFWKQPGVDPKTVETEVFLLPASASVEKDGSQANSGRWMQWKYAAAKAPGDCLPVGEMMVRILAAVRKLYQKEGGVFPEPILGANLDYLDAKGHYDAEKVARIINGYFTRDTTIDGVTYKKGECVPGFALLQNDGSTACGNWVCSGSFTREGANLMKRRGKTDPTGLGLYPEWSYSWPANRRIIYNRASVDPTGKPWNPKRVLVEWKDGKWVGDVIDGGSAPLAAEGGKLPFIMRPEGVGCLFGPGLADGPFPEHYEPVESPFARNPLSNQLHTPLVRIYESDRSKFSNASPEYPVVMTTYSCTEHWCTGAFTRWQPWLLDTQPGAYVEMSEEFAAERGIKNGDRIKVVSPRGSVEAAAMVTPRMTPFQCGDKKVHLVGMTFNYGWMTKGGDSANLLTPMVGDTNSMTPEYKAFMVNIEKLPAAEAAPVKEA